MREENTSQSPKLVQLTSEIRPQIVVENCCDYDCGYGYCYSLSLCLSLNLGLV